MADTLPASESLLLCCAQCAVAFVVLRFAEIDMQELHSVISASTQIKHVECHLLGCTISAGMVLTEIHAISYPHYGMTSIAVFPVLLSFLCQLLVA